jgi:encore-like protein
LQIKTCVKFLFGCADSSTEQYTDSTGVDLQQFIMDTLNRNQKDRILLLKIEQELVNLAKDNK